MNCGIADAYSQTLQMFQNLVHFSNPRAPFRGVSRIFLWGMNDSFSPTFQPLPNFIEGAPDRDAPEYVCLA